MQNAYDADPGDDTESIALDDQDSNRRVEDMPAENPDEAAASSGQTVSDAELDRGLDAVGDQLSNAGVSESSLGPALGFLLAATQGGLPQAPAIRTDRYAGIDGSGFQAHEIPDLTRFLAVMDQANVPEADVRGMLDWFQSQRTALAKHGVEQRATPKYSNRADARIAQIEQIMRTDRRKYFRDEGLQDEYRMLLRQRGAR